MKMKSKHPSQKHYRKPVVQHQDYSTETKWNQTEPCRRSKEKLAIFMVFLLEQRRAPTRHSDNEWGKEPTVPKATQQQLTRQTQRTTNDYCCEEQ